MQLFGRKKKNHFHVVVIWQLLSLGKHTKNFYTYA